MRTRALTRIRNRGGNDPRYTQERLQTRTQTVPEPNEDNLLEVCKTLKEAVETLSGERGEIHNNGVSFADLEALDLITIKEANKDIQSNFLRVVEDWHVIGATGEPAFENSWADAGVNPAFYKDLYGRVHLKGALSTGASGTTAFTLPSGYRPPEDMYFLALGAAAVAGNYVYITTAGLVQPTITGANIGINSLSFRAA